MNCPVCLWVGTNASPEMFKGNDCWNCGKPLTAHPIEVKENIPTNKMFAVDPGAIQSKCLNDIQRNNHRS